MIILGIETSCDETALSIIDADANSERGKIKILGNVLISQIKIHEQYGGVFPMVAKREHAKNLTPLLHKVVLESSLYKKGQNALPEARSISIKEILKKEEGLYEVLMKFLEDSEKPKIDLIAVTSGPGLEPALWVGISFAKALGLAWDIQVMPVNHMEGHIAGSFLKNAASANPSTRIEPAYPALALLISGGHTELVLAKKWGDYQIIGKTLDDAVGEAFDKAARILGLPYPGGPQISALAAADRKKDPVAVSAKENRFKLPRPMLHSASLDLSFSGIKTAVLYMVTGGQKKGRKIEPLETDLSADDKMHIAREFEDAVTEVLVAKTSKAIDQNDIRTLILGGGVSANTYIRENFTTLARERGLPLLLPEADLTTDNALMIALAAYLNFSKKILKKDSKSFKAEGNLSL